MFTKDTNKGATILMRIQHFIFCIGFSIIIPLFFLMSDAYGAELDCIIEPYLVVNVGSEVPGVIETVDVDRGDFVKKGQILARLQSKVEQANVELIRARLDFAIRDHKRNSELYKDGVIPFYDMDKAETNLEIVKRELKQAEEVVERRIIRSTIDGVVVERFLSAGDRVEQQPIMKLAQIDPLNVEVIAPVTMFGSVKVGARAEVKPEKPVGRVYIGRIKIVDHVIDAASGTFRIRIELPNEKYRLPAGLKCSVRFLKR